MPESSVQPNPRRHHLAQGARSMLAILSVIIVTIVILMMMASTAQRLKNQSRKDLKREMSAVLTTTRGALSLWKESVQADQELLSELPIIHHMLEEAWSDTSALTLQRALNPWLKTKRYLGYGVFKNDSQGNPKLILKKDIEQDEVFAKSEAILHRAAKGHFAIGRPIIFANDEVVTVTASPVKNAAGETIGVLCFLVDLHTRFTEATQLGRMGESGETYAINEQGQMITPSRFKVGPTKGKPFISTKHPLFLETINHFTGTGVSFNLEGYNDYRGVPVIGAWTWDPDLGLGLITEIDKWEAYRSYDTIQGLVWIMSIIVIIGMIFLLLFREILSRNKINNLKMLEESRKDLMSIVSHDLKNPLSSLLITNDILLKNLSRDSDTFVRNRSLLEKNFRAADQMKKLINDLLDSTRIEAGKLEIHPKQCDGSKILHHSMELIEPAASAKQITLLVETPADLPHVSADPERLAQVFSNLLGNAVKFTPEGGKIVTEARVLDGSVLFSVRDTGPGIPHEEQAYLFDRFWQASKTKQLGTGLGLSICRDLVSAHGGDIWAESEPGQGATFHFTIPVYNS